MHKLEVKKPDGRDLTLYSRQPLPSTMDTSGTLTQESLKMAHMRWHSLRGEWVAYAQHRQNRTFFPPNGFNPFISTDRSEFPTELPPGDYEMAAFENLFPSFFKNADEAPDLFVPTAPSQGRCEVIVFDREPNASLGSLPLPQIELLLEVWKDRYRQIAKQQNIEYILPFENKGSEVGVTLHHPHGQIYAYSQLPPTVLNYKESQKKFYAKNNKTLIGDLLEQEIKDDKRVVVAGESTIAFVPIFARYPYEVWIAPRRPVQSLTDLTEEESKDFAKTLKTMLLKYDGLWNRPFPYLMLLYSAPSRGDHPEWHFHIQFYPPYRSKDRLKFLAGTELGAGMFINDSLPEEKARELREVQV